METDVAVEKFRQHFDAHCEDSLLDGVSDTVFAEACARSGLVATDEVAEDGEIVFKLRGEPVEWDGVIEMVMLEIAVAEASRDGMDCDAGELDGEAIAVAEATESLMGKLLPRFGRSSCDCKAWVEVGPFYLPYLFMLSSSGDRLLRIAIKEVHSRSEADLARIVAWLEHPDGYDRAVPYDDAYGHGFETHILLWDGPGVGDGARHIPNRAVPWNVGDAVDWRYDALPEPRPVGEIVGENRRLLLRQIVGNVKLCDVNGGVQAIYCSGNIIVYDDGTLIFTVCKKQSGWDHWMLRTTERAEPFWELGRVLEAAAVRDRWSVDWYFRWGLAHGYEFVSSTYREKEDYLG
jgi:hypothetical protein